MQSGEAVASTNPFADSEIWQAMTADKRRRLASAMAAMQSADPVAVADAVVAQLGQMLANMNDMPKYAFRQWLASVVSRVTVDLETKAAEIELALTLDLAQGLQNRDLPMRLIGTLESSTSSETHPAIRVELGRFDCTEVWIGVRGWIGRPCYQCRRRSA
jgi:hypothetical protein